MILSHKLFCSKMNSMNDTPLYFTLRSIHIPMLSLLLGLLWSFIVPLDVSGADRKLTAADWAGPDGIIYPNFSRAGIPGGIPDVKIVANVADFGAVPNDDKCDAEAFNKAIEKAASLGGGAILVPEGTYFLDSPVVINSSGIVIRGEDRKKSVIVPRFKDQDLPSPYKSVKAFSFSPKAQAKTKEALLTSDAHRGDIVVSCKETPFKAGDWVEVVLGLVPPDVKNMLSPQLYKEADKKGEAWQVITYHYNRAMVVKVDGNQITLDRPLRGDLTVALKAKVMLRNQPIERCGLENLTISQEVGKKGINAVGMTDTAYCWMRGVTILKIGNWPYSVSKSSNFEVKDCLFDETRSSGGGVGYVGVNFATDGLFEDVTLTRLRHLSVSIGSQGNVFRRCHLENIDINFHLMWPSENLFDNCVVDTRGGHGSYEFGIYTPRYHGDMHLPAGSHNTFYNNDITSHFDAVFLGGGATTDGVFAYNRFVSETGAGVVLKKGSDRNVFFSNVFCLKDYKSHKVWHKEQNYFEGKSTEKWSGGVIAMSGPLSGNIFANNSFYGVPADDLFVGVNTSMSKVNNEVHQEFQVPDRPRAPASSLYALQRGEGMAALESK